MKRLSTIKDIAAKLNIHNSTVSRALREHPDINEETKKRVLEAAKELNYFPNKVAQSLKTNKNNRIGIVVPDLSKPFFATIIHSIIKDAALKKYQAIITVSLEDPELEKENIYTLISERVDGMLVCTTLNSESPEIFELVNKNNIPLVFYDRVPDLKKFSSVSIDNYNTVFSSIDFLIEQGYKKLGIFYGSSLIPMGRERVQGYKDALQKNNIVVEEKWMVDKCNSKIDGYENLIKLYDNKLLPEIIFTSNSIIAQGIYEAAQALGIKIPNDLSVIGFGPDKELSNLLSPKLTYIRTFPEQIGSNAFKLLINEIESTKVTKPKKIYIPVKFEIHDSCSIQNVSNVMKTKNNSIWFEKSADLPYSKL